MNKVEVNNLEPYHINYVHASWLDLEKDAIGIFIDFTINAGDTVTHEFNKSTGDEPDTLIYYIKNNPNDLTGVSNYTNSIYETSNHVGGPSLNIRLVIVDVHGLLSPKPDVNIRYILG